MWHNVNSLNICVIGSGAVGGLIGGHMAEAGASVTLVDKGEHLNALVNNGLTLISRDGRQRRITQIDATDNPTLDESIDICIIGVKSYDLSSIATMLLDTIDDETVILPVQNGIPWWYFNDIKTSFDGYQIDAVDPDGILSQTIDSKQVVGCIPFVAASVSKPGTVKHINGEWFPVGEITNERTERVQGIAELFETSGLRSRVLDDIRSELWLKEIGNLAFNPISVLTKSTLRELCRDPGTRATAQRMMEEAKPVAEELGVSFRRTIEERIDGAERVGEHKTSMLQDLENNKKLETEALVGAVIELAELVEKQVPLIKSIYHLTKMLEKSDA